MACVLFGLTVFLYCVVSDFRVYLGVMLIWGLTGSEAFAKDANV